MLAFYLRLSKAEKEKEESNSIQLQRELLQQSLTVYGFSKEEIVEYIDDGYSGKNFDRPGIKRLFLDIENGKIQVILVKDFSRFGRNYREVSEYLEKKFPERGIRFIAVNNGYDRNPLQDIVRKKGGNSFDSISKNGTVNSFQNRKIEKESGSYIFQNILDEYYNRENSSKIKQALFQRKKEGEYLAPFAPYGYKKDAKQPKHLVIDKEAAEVVKLIFQMRCEGKSGGEIARYLNSKKISSPLDYRNGRTGEHIWQSEVIWAILHNREYLGNLVVRKYDAIRKLPLDQWIEIEGTHRAIIDREQFEYAQIIEKGLQKRKEKKAEVSKISGLKGLVICSGCGHKMKRNEQKRPCFFCKYYYYDKNFLCIRTGIKEKWLFQIIEKILEETIDGFGRGSCYQQYQNCYQKKQKSWKAKEKRLEKRRRTEAYFFYESWKSGRLSAENYERKMEEWKQKGEKIQKKKEIVHRMEEPIFFAGFLREILLEILINSLGEVKIRFQVKKG